jgi:GT2 family glycosyltransferase
VQVSFIIPLFNNLALTRACVDSLQATLPSGLTHEIILVDDGSTDDTRAWLSTLTPPFRVVLNDRNLGYAAANNRAIALARGEFLALLNNDLVLLPHWLEPMFGAHRSLADRAGFIGNIQLDARTGHVDHTGIVINHQGKPVHDRALPPLRSRLLSKVRPVPAITGACVLVERDLWQRLGGFRRGLHQRRRRRRPLLPRPCRRPHQRRRPRQRRPPPHQRLRRPQTSRRTKLLPPRPPLAPRIPRRRKRRRQLVSRLLRKNPP